MNFAIEHITNNMDICNRISKLVSEHRRYKRDYIICLDNVKHFKYNMMYLENLNQNVDMWVMNTYSMDKYNQIQESILNNDIIEMSFYKFDRGRKHSLMTTLYRISHYNECPSRNILINYIKFLIRLYDLKHVFTRHMYQQIQYSKLINP